ncbi:TonB family protein [Sinimarinibacterium flocculans]|uniref:TonB family protein n=1 Tax=Sinimarinibacterium flocculans TaxID=985250 RepID=UPI002492BFA7|nr:TonB family protein [Sinimarinibacterium flocculans]
MQIFAVLLLSALPVVNPEQTPAERYEPPPEIAIWGGKISTAILNAYEESERVAHRFSCVIEIEQDPEGNVLHARLVKRCGGASADRAVMLAVWRASPLPKAPKPSLFERRIRISFCPGPNRC